MAGIYVHIPYCKQACHYCDFHFSTNTANRHDLVACMAQEIEIQKDYLQKEHIQSVYFGGGTPSLLPIEDLSHLVGVLYHFFAVESHAEVTLEGNPDDLDLSKLKQLRSVGFNRLSIGIQSFDDDVLKFLNRAHSSTAALESVQDARKAGFENISIDLIYGIPGQNFDQWRENIKLALDLKPEHISAYTLTIEDKTAFGRWVARGQIKTVDDELVAVHLETLIDELSIAGYEQYEVSNFCLPGFESKHNSSYWKQSKYLGIGPSAHSYDKITRQHNVRNNHLYVREIKAGRIPCELEILSQNDLVNEYLLTTLRTSWGSDLNTLKYQFNYDILAVHHQLIGKLLEGKYAIIEDNFLKLTRSGKMIADKICADLFLVS